jgi:hypothetical protein
MATPQLEIGLLRILEIPGAIKKRVVRNPRRNRCLIGKWRHMHKVAM